MNKLMLRLMLVGQVEAVEIVVQETMREVNEATAGREMVGTDLATMTVTFTDFCSFKNKTNSIFFPTGDRGYGDRGGYSRGRDEN